MVRKALVRPNTMTAVGMVMPGGPEVLRVMSRPVPTPAENEVLIRVTAAGVNRADVAERNEWTSPAGAPRILGLEVAGHVVEVGPRVTRWKTGDRVAALLCCGGYAEYAVADAGSVLSAPERFSDVESAALPAALFTVWDSLFERGAFEPGETVLIHGGSSGIGTLAIQIAATFGATVLATAGSDAKCDACLSLGASFAINYRTDDFVAAVHEATRGHGADVILDVVGGDYTARNIAAAAEDGRIIQVAFMRGSAVMLDLSPLQAKRVTLTGGRLSGRSARFKASLARAVESEVWPLVRKGRVRPVIDISLPLRDAATAHARIESGQHIGKIVLEVA